MTLLTLNPLIYIIYAIRILLISCCAMAIAIICWMYYPKQQQQIALPVEKIRHIPFLFSRPAETYQSIGKNLLVLDSKTSRLSLPNLRQEFIFYGSNDRPDATTQDPILFLSTKGSDEIRAIPSNSRVYLSKESSLGKTSYRLTSEKTFGGIWIEAQMAGQEAHINLCFDDGSSTPSTPVEFNLKQEPRPALWKSWEIGSHKVDNSLLARQKARWVGKDLFLEQHGGTELKPQNQKHRLDFEENSKLYSCFVQEGDCLIWKDDRWELAEPGESTQAFSMLQIKRMDERLMNLIMWNPEGKYKVSLSLIKLQDPSEAYKNINAFHYLGAKSWNEWIFEINGKRQIVKAKDWWLRSDTGWKKLATKEEIEAFVNLQVRGDLFVIDNIVQRDRQRFLNGHIFNASRTKMHEIRLPIKQHKTSANSQPATKNNDISPAPEKSDKTPEQPPAPSVSKTGEPCNKSIQEECLKLPSVIRGRTQ